MSKLLIILSLLVNSLLGQSQNQLSDLPWGSVEDNFIGGLSEFYHVFHLQVKYPDSLQEEQITGTVYFRIEIDTSGSIVNFEKIRGVHPLMDKEVEDKIYLTNGMWKPLLVEGKKVNYQVVEKVYFRIR